MRGIEIPEARYPFTPSGQPTQRAQNISVGSGGAPSEFPPPGRNEPLTFAPDFGWSGSPTPPSTATADPHDTPYTKNPTGTFEPLGPQGGLPGNIHDHIGMPGPFSAVQAPLWVRPGVLQDPHG